MLNELDGMNKYLQGVRMPSAIAGRNNFQGSYTLKQMRKEDQKQGDYNALYKRQ